MVELAAVIGLTAALVGLVDRGGSQALVQALAALIAGIAGYRSYQNGTHRDD